MAEEKVSPFSVLPEPNKPQLVHHLLIEKGNQGQEDVLSWFNGNIDMTRNDLIRGLVKTLSSVCAMANNQEARIKKLEEKIANRKA